MEIIHIYHNKRNIYQKISREVYRDCGGALEHTAQVVESLNKKVIGNQFYRQITIFQVQVTQDQFKSSH